MNAPHLIDGLTRNEFVDTPYPGEGMTTSAMILPNEDTFVVVMQAYAAGLGRLQSGSFGLSRDGLRALVELGTRLLGDRT